MDLATVGREVSRLIGIAYRRGIFETCILRGVGWLAWTTITLISVLGGAAEAGVNTDRLALIASVGVVLVVVIGYFGLQMSSRD